MVTTAANPQPQPTTLTLQKRRRSSLAKRRSVSGPAQGQNQTLTPGGGSSTSKNLRRLSLQFSSSVSSLISFTSQGNSISEQTVTSIPLPPQKCPLIVDYQLHAKVKVGDNENTLQIYTPQYALKCCEFILSNGIVEGIFRMNGSIRNVSSMEKKLANDSLPLNWRFLLLKDNQTVEDPETVFVTPHDVATLLKRWISRIEGGIITKNVGHKINNLLLLSDSNGYSIDGKSEHATTPTDTPITINNPLFDTPKQQVYNYEDDDYLKTPTDEKPNEFKNINDNEIPIRASNRIPELYINLLSKLPIQNLHLLVYLLSVFNKFNNVEVIKKTRMDSSNIAKMMQLSIFNTDGLVKESKDNFSSMESFSELKTIYDNFEKVLTNWIEFYDHLLDQLKPIIESRMNDMEHLLNSEHATNNKVLKKMKSEESLPSILSYNDDFDVNFSKVNETPSAVKITTVITDTTNVTHGLPIINLDNNDDDNASIVYTPIDMKNKILVNDFDQSNENIDPAPIISKVSNSPSLPKTRIDANKTNKPKQGLGLKFKGFFKKKNGTEKYTSVPVPPVSDNGNPSEINISKRNDVKLESKKEKRKSSFQFLTKS